MTTQKEKAERFAALHVAGDPLILFNIWDAGSAKAVTDAGAKAIATGSWSVAAAYGFADGEDLPLDTAIANIERIAASVDLPVSLDFEGGYAADTAGLEANITRVIGAGAIGINFEDQIVGGEGLYSIEEQSARIKAIRRAADATGVPLFINARTDVYLVTDPADHAAHLGESLTRAAAYSEAGASGIFLPGLKDPDLIRTACERTPLPVNILVMADTPSNETMAGLGVARLSYGAGPFRLMIEALKTAAGAAFGNEQE